MPERPPVRVDQTLSCVMPVSLDEAGTMDWRHRPDTGAVARLRLMLGSFVRLFDQADLDTFWIPCPPTSCTAVAALVREITTDPRYRVVSERDIAPEIASLGGERIGWFIQQILKLAIGEYIDAPFYLTFDSDIICTRRFAFDDVVRHGRAMVNVERAQDYVDLYGPEVAQAEPQIKARRFAWAERILGQPRPSRYTGRFYGETPVVMHTASVRQLVQHLGRTLGQPWRRALGEAVPFTEYTLYFSFLEATGQLERVCELVDRRTVLDLDRSIWKRPDQCRRPLDLERWSPFEGDERGLFVAVQSYLGPESWLPASVGSVEQFYARLARLLERAASPARDYDDLSS